MFCFPAMARVVFIMSQIDTNYNIQLYRDTLDLLTIQKYYSGRENISYANKKNYYINFKGGFFHRKLFH